MTKNKPIYVLKERQFAFINAYIETGNIINAYRSINPECKIKDIYPYAIKMFKGERVQSEIKDLQHRMSKELEITFAWKANKLKTMLEECMRMREVKDNEGNVIDRYIPSEYINAGSKVIAELNKMQGHYAPEKHIVVNVDAPVEKIRSTLIEYDKY